jgi:CPA1 family monovalent cation:H+ antiporter
VQLRPIWEALHGYAIADLAMAAVLTSLTVILVRIGWVALSSAIPRLMTPRRGATNERLRWQDVVVFSWAGLRGGDTLAGALAVSFVVNSGAPFPAREEIIFLAFAVVVATLVGQGLTLPPLRGSQTSRYHSLPAAQGWIIRSAWSRTPEIRASSSGSS